MAALERTWRDQEQKKFAEEFQQQIQVVRPLHRSRSTATSPTCCGRRKSSRSTCNRGSRTPWAGPLASRRSASWTPRSSPCSDSAARPPECWRSCRSKCSGPWNGSTTTARTIGRDELRRSWEGVSAARIQLQQAQVSRRIAGREPACIDEKRALERAKRRQETAKQKVQAVKHWTQVLDRAADEFQQSRTQFATWLDTDLVEAVAALNRMSVSLESYTSLAGPAVSGTRTPPSGKTAEPDVEKKEPGP